MAKLIAASARGDVAALTALFRPPLGSGGVWFEDPGCRREFLTAGTIDGDRVAALARCFAGARLVASPRKSAFPDIGVVMYEPGIELEVLFAQDIDGIRVTWIGYAGRRDAQDALPTVTQAALESHLIDRRPIELDEASRAAIARELSSRRFVRSAYAWFKVCIGVDGALTGVHPRMTTSFVAQDAFTAAVSQWRFRPFVLDGQSTPVCSLVYVDGSPEPSTHQVFPLPVPDDHADAIVVPTDLIDDERIAGMSGVAPDPEIREAIRRRGLSIVRGVFEYCIDASGKTTRPIIVRSTTFPRYDRMIQSVIARWRYRPPDVGGRSVVACTFTTHVFNVAEEWQRRATGRNVD